MQTLGDVLEVYNGIDVQVSLGLFGQDVLVDVALKRLSELLDPIPS